MVQRENSGVHCDISCGVPYYFQITRHRRRGRAVATSLSLEAEFGQVVGQLDADVAVGDARRLHKPKGNAVGPGGSPLSSSDSSGAAGCSALACQLIIPSDPIISSDLLPSFWNLSLHGRVYLPLTRCLKASKDVFAQAFFFYRFVD